MGQHYQAKYEQLSSLQKQKGTIFVSLGLGKGRYFGKKYKSELILFPVQGRRNQLVHVRGRNKQP